MKRIRLTLMGVAATMVVAGAFVASRVSGTEPAAEDEVGGDSRDLVETVEPITPGVYQGDAFTTQAIEEYNAALPVQGEWFEGELNGIRVDSGEHPCNDIQRSMTALEIEQYLPPLPENLPQGAVETEKPRGLFCGSDPLAVQRVLAIRGGPYHLAIVRVFGSNQLRARAGTNRVEAGTIQSRPAILIRPLIPRGTGESYVGFMEGEDLIYFEGLNIRFTDLLAAADSFPV